MNEGFNAERIVSESKSRWTNLLEQSLYPSYRNSWTYAYLNQNKNRIVITYIFTKHGEDIAGVHYSLKKSRFYVLKVVDIVNGFVFKYEPEIETLRYLINHFLKFAQSTKAAYIHFNPWLPFRIGSTETKYKSVFEGILLNAGFKEIKDGRHTYWLDLTQKDEILLERMDRKTRYQIKLGVKSKTKTTILSEAKPDIIHLFWGLYKKIGERKRFSMYSEDKFKRELSELLKNGEAKLFILEYDNEIINMSLASTMGISSYMHGAINHQYKEIKNCPSPGQLAQWEMIKEMKRIGLKTYDLGFCPGPVPDISNPFYRIWRFKYNFGGEHVQFMATYGKVLKPISGRVFEFLMYRKR